MPTHAPARAIRRWQAAFIIALFFVAVAGSAAVGWWYARESPPHQGPILLISIGGLPATDLASYGAERTDTPAIDALAQESIVFERAYTHSPHTLPSHASILTGQLPPEHGIRDEAGFTLPTSARTLAELLRNRGFVTGAAVSTFLLRAQSGLSQGFSFFDAEIPGPNGDEVPALEREGALTLDAAERWIEMRSGQRFFLFVQVDGRDADAAVARLSAALKQRRLYDEATIVIVGDHGEAGSGMSLDDTALRIPLIVKQPNGGGAGRRVSAPVQHIDLVPTILDLVRAPGAGGLHGRSLRPVLDDDEAVLAAQPIYAESYAAYFRFGGTPIFALTGDHYRYVRGVDEELVPIAPPVDEAAAGGESTEAGRLRSTLDQMLASNTLTAPAPLPPADEERYALLGYLSGFPHAASVETKLDATVQKATVDAHRAAAILIGQKKYSAGIRALQAIVHTHAPLAAVHYQLGAQLLRMGRLDEAIQSFDTVRELRPDAAAGALALADTLMHAGKTMLAREQADVAVALAEHEDTRVLAAAHEMAARVALSEKDAESATRHAESAHAANASLPVPQYVRGRLLYDEGKYEQAAAQFKAAEATLRENGGTMADLHLYFGESLARLDRYPDAETQFREELLAYPRNVQAYTSLAMLYRASNRDADVEDVLNELVAATPTPEGYAVAAKLWTILGERSRAEALRSDARARFRGDPSLAQREQDGRR
jgi:tetratricopeptide (TPR) repeat protein